MKDFLISAGFTQSTTNPAAKDYNPLTRCDCYIRVSDVHYLCWYENIQHFSIVHKLEHPKGLPGGGDGQFVEIVLPIAIKTYEDLLSVRSVFGILDNPADKDDF